MEQGSFYEVREGIGARWNLFKNGQQQDGFEIHREGAVGLAIEQARKDLAAGHEAVVVSVLPDGSLKKEWPVET